MITTFILVVAVVSISVWVGVQYEKENSLYQIDKAYSMGFNNGYEDAIFEAKFAEKKVKKTTKKGAKKKVKKTK